MLQVTLQRLVWIQPHLPSWSPTLVQGQQGQQAGDGTLPHHCKLLFGLESTYILLQVALLKNLASMGSMQAEARRITAKMADKLLEVGLTEQTVRSTQVLLCHATHSTPPCCTWLGVWRGA